MKDDFSRIGTNSGHGHVWPRPDGVKARCGGAELCVECGADRALLLLSTRLVVGSVGGGPMTAYEALQMQRHAATPADSGDRRLDWFLEDLEHRMVRVAVFSNLNTMAPEAVWGLFIECVRASGGKLGRNLPPDGI